MSEMEPQGVDTCLYGSVIGLQSLKEQDQLESPPSLHRSRTPSPIAEEAQSAINRLTSNSTSSNSICDECEYLQASFYCQDCDLVYCSKCNLYRHRKGKLVQHRRQEITSTNEVLSSSNESFASSSTTTSSFGHQDRTFHRTPTNIPANSWNQEEVQKWLMEHELDCFTNEFQEHSINGAFLISMRMDEFLDTISSAPRAYKKKLSREIQKLKSDGVEEENTAGTTSALFLRASVSPPAPPSFPPTFASNPARRNTFNLRVNVNTHQASPVASLRSRINHGQVDESKGRITRRRSAHPNLTVATGCSEMNAPTGVTSLRPPALAIKTSEARLNDQTATIKSQNNPRPPMINIQNSGQNLRQIRNALEGLDLERVKQEGKALDASFDFSAEGRLQTQGFEINTNGIAHTPFQDQFSNTKSQPVQLGTKEYLIMLNELGQGAGGKVYKAIYVPTFRLVAVKVIRVYDQKKRHQMVRELKSLYANFVSITEADSKQAACKDLVVFYDAYTNPEIGSVSIVLEFMNGGSLEDLMQSGHKCSEHEIANIAKCVLKGLAFLHEHHQLHRDIKLSNMLINHEQKVKISDFGISRDLESTLAKATTFTGTLLYMAPERISGGTYSYPSDIWAFGLALMGCAIGRLPVPTKEGYWGVVHAVKDQPSPRLVDYGDFSPQLCDFLDQCLQKNPMLRPPAAKLLDHPFLKQFPDTQKPIENSYVGKHVQTPNKNLEELDRIALLVEQWCERHASTLLSPPPTTTSSSVASSSLFKATSSEKKLDLLARQLNVPLEIVRSKFHFLEKY